jgi:cellulose biosynthesis protein BcsQ
MRGEPLPQRAWEGGPRPFQVLTVANNKGGIGKTTIATNLAVYLRALREDLPILCMGFDDQPMLDRMLALDTEAPAEDVVSAMRAGTFAPAVRLGQYGVHYVPSNPGVSELKREIDDPFYLRTVLGRTDWRGLVIIDTKSDFEILTRNAIAASDLTLVVVQDQESLAQAQRVFDLLREWKWRRERARILLSLVDLRIKYHSGETRDVLGHLVFEIRRLGYPLFETFLSRSPKVEALYTNPEGRAISILHGAEGSLIHRQMHHLAGDVLAALETLAPHTGNAAPPSAQWGPLFIDGARHRGCG